MAEEEIKSGSEAVFSQVYNSRGLVVVSKEEAHRSILQEWKNLKVYSTLSDAAKSELEQLSALAVDAVDGLLINTKTDGEEESNETFLTLNNMTTVSHQNISCK